MRISADLPMETTSLLPNKSTRVKRKNAMDFGTKDAVVTARDASSATSKQDGKIKHAYWGYKHTVYKEKAKKSVQS